MTRTRNQKRREKRRAWNRAKKEKLLALPTGGGPFAGRAKLAFQTRKGDAVNELLGFEFEETPPPPTKGVQHHQNNDHHLEFWGEGPGPCPPLP